MSIERTEQVTVCPMVAAMARAMQRRLEETRLLDDAPYVSSLASRAMACMSSVLLGVFRGYTNDLALDGSADVANLLGLMIYTQGGQRREPE